MRESMSILEIRQGSQPCSQAQDGAARGLQSDPTRPALEWCEFASNTHQGVGTVK